MQIAKLWIAVMALSVPLWAGAQAPAPPEVFSGTANIKNGTGAVSGTLEVRLRRLTPDFDRNVVETALKEGGYPRFVTAIRSAPEVGQVVLGGGKPTAIRYARERNEAGARHLVLVTDQPMYFVGGGRAEGSAPRKGFEVAVVELQLDAKGAGKGSMAAAARVRPDGNGGVLLDDYADALITLTNLARRPS